MFTQYCSVHVRCAQPAHNGQRHLTSQSHLHQYNNSQVPVHSVFSLFLSGVLAQRSETPDLPGDTYINADYIKFLESVGARVVPILYVKRCLRLFVQLVHFVVLTKNVTHG